MITDGQFMRSLAGIGMSRPGTVRIEPVLVLYLDRGPAEGPARCRRTRGLALVDGLTLDAQVLAVECYESESLDALRVPDETDYLIDFVEDLVATPLREKLNAEVEISAVTTVTA